MGSIQVAGADPSSGSAAEAGRTRTFRPHQEACQPWRCDEGDRPEECAGGRRSAVKCCESGGGRRNEEGSGSRKSGEGHQKATWPAEGFDSFRHMGHVFSPEPQNLTVLGGRVSFHHMSRKIGGREKQVRVSKFFGKKAKNRLQFK